MAAPKTPPQQSDNPAAQRRWLVTILAGLLLTAGVSVAVALPRNDPPPEPETGATEPLAQDGSSTASCVETYDLSSLAGREVAFDGTVESVSGDSVTFTVNRGYRGVDTERVTLRGASTLSAMTSAGAEVDLEPGARLLVAGDAGFAWGCGFTQAYDAAVAEDWAATFAG